MQNSGFEYRLLHIGIAYFPNVHIYNTFRAIPKLTLEKLAAMIKFLCAFIFENFASRHVLTIIIMMEYDHHKFDAIT